MGFLNIQRNSSNKAVEQTDNHNFSLAAQKTSRYDYLLTFTLLC